MKTILLIITWGICLVTGLSAQVVVLHTMGTVEYFAKPGASPMRMYPGLEIEAVGTMRCQKSASAKLLYKGSTFLVSGGKTRNVAEIVGAQNPASQLSFPGRFWIFLSESVQESESTEKLQKYHRRYMGKTSAAVRGYALREHSILPLLTGSGKLPNANVIFKWRNTPGKGAYTFLLREPDGKLVAQLLVRDTMVTLNLEQLQMDIQAEYEWFVTRDNGVANSAPASFTLLSNPTQNAEKLLSQEKYYQEASPAEQQMMLAYYLEEERCYYSANEVYTRLLADDPDNRLLRKTYAAFLARMDMMPESMTLINRK